MKLYEIEDLVSSFPTIMGLSNDLLIINKLMIVTTDDIIENKELFCSIVNRIWLSYTDSGFMELTKENEGELIRFSQWLHKIQAELRLELSDSLIEDFNLTVEEINRMMGRLDSKSNEVVCK
ncbi:MAG: hypothetical protein FWH46_04585 [Methanimicrococcus sp.]|nr:hypothetical protein [Methanimicrococcus sp.]